MSTLWSDIEIVIQVLLAIAVILCTKKRDFLLLKAAFTTTFRYVLCVLLINFGFVQARDV
jgi:hypothetical protein